MNADAVRLPPHSPEAERAVLGCLLIAGNEAASDPVRAGEVVEECLRRKLTPGHFYDLRHADLCQAILRLAEQRRPADMVLLVQSLQASGQLESVGGMLYINQIVDEVPSIANLTYYLDTVMEKWALRQSIRLCSETIANSYEHAGPVEAFMSNFEARAMELAETHVPTEYVQLPTCVPHYIDAIESRHRGKQEITGLATPFWYLNNITCGLQPRELVIIGARPSCGKTAIALELMRHALRVGKGVLFFSIEMARQEIMGRLVAAEARVDGIKLRNGFWSDAKQDAIVDATGRIATWHNFLIDDRSVITGQDVFIGARRAMRQHDIGLVVVDYIQLMQSVRNYPTRMEAVAEASTWLKRTAKDLGIPVVACAQLSRDSEKERGGKPPLMSDLRECGQIEQDADVIMLMYEPRIDDDDFDDMKWLAHHTPDDPKEDSEWHTSEPTTVSGGGGKQVEVNPAWREEFRRINLVVAKNRNGQTGPCELVYQKRSTRFVDAHSPKRIKEDRGQLI